MTDPSLAATDAMLGELRIGGIFSRALNILSQNFVPFALLTGLATLPTLLIALGLSGGGVARHPGWFAIVEIVQVVLLYLAQGFVLYAAFQDMLNRHVNAGESLSIALARFFPIVGAAICVGLAGAFGMLLLIVPGIIWFLMWSVTIPVVVVEQLGPIQAMRRSAELTRGHRWKIFGIFLLLFLINVISRAILAAILHAIGGAWFEGIGLWVWSALIIAFGAIMTTIIYHDLRVAKEGVNTEQIAAVFA
jgi:hypothetical protein